MGLKKFYILGARSWGLLRLLPTQPYLRGETWVVPDSSGKALSVPTATSPSWGDRILIQAGWAGYHLSFYLSTPLSEAGGWGEEVRRDVDILWAAGSILIVGFGELPTESSIRRS